MTKNEQLKFIQALRTKRYSTAKKIVNGISKETRPFAIIRNIANEKGRSTTNARLAKKYKTLAGKARDAAAAVKRGGNPSAARYVGMLANVK